ncbi:flavin reductase family protein [Aquamicrobium sp.]|uniref:flavin reductase family protein n=1 Tax=Aquamicrobium sp. TaxID=1872579 RepID=UPI00258CA4FB|nr:flavin reductase family protein [Aquamicrobium sp.]MCK9551506.1 flavin reductase family protein [Aquamicrobium sp.]
MGIATLEPLNGQPYRQVAKPVFTSAMANMASTVCVVTAECAGFCPGRTVTAMLSLSAEPPLILVSIQTGCALADTILAGKGFSLAMLAEGQEMVADAFAGKVAPDKRYLMGVWEWWLSGRPRLFGSAVSLDCELEGAMPIADHTLFAGRVVAADIAAFRAPLLWHQRGYGKLQR